MIIPRPFPAGRRPGLCAIGLAVIAALPGVAFADPPDAGESVAATSALEQCRAARHVSADSALELCRQALAVAHDAEARFELRMHLSELATSAGDWALAAEHLDAAAVDVARVADPLAGHRLARRRGMLAFRRGETARALAQFLDGLELARRDENHRAEAISHNDLGLVYRQLGEDREALEHWLISLDLKQQAGDRDLAATQANLGALYQDLGEVEQARGFLQQAIAGHAANDRPLQVAHSREALALIEAAHGDPAAAMSTLAEVWTRFADAGAVPDQQRVALHLARLALDQQQTDTARHWLREAGAHAIGSEPPLQLSLLEARLLRQAGDDAGSLRLLQARLPWPGRATPALRVQAWRDLSDSAERSGQPAAALEYLRAAEVLADEIEQSRHGEQMNALRVRFELAELERERSRLQRENVGQQLLLETRRRQILTIGIGALLLSGVVALVFQRRLYRQRLALLAREAEQRARAEQAMRDAELLRADLRSVQRALDETSEALLVVDASGRIRSANQSAADRLQQPAARLPGQTLRELFGEQAARQLIDAQDRVADGNADDGEPATRLQTVSVAHVSGPLQVRVLSLSLEEELGVLALEPIESSGDWMQRLNRDHGMAPSPAAGTGADHDSGFRQRLVQLMRHSLELWERVTRSSRIELAERSGIWRVTIDDGRLRTRTLDRYLSEDTLPAKPRWREGVRTAYFVLAECPLADDQRGQLENALQAVLDGAPRR